MAPITSSGQDYLGFAYAVLLAAGGIIGAVRKGSLMSLVMGLGGGYLASVGAKKVTENKHDVYLSLAVSWTLTVIMGIRFMRKWSFMPAGLIMVVSVFMGSYYSLQLVDADTGPIHIPGTKLEL